MTDNTPLNADDGMKMPLGKRKLRELIEDAWYDAPSASAGFGRIEVIIEQQINAHTNAEIAKVLDRIEATKTIYKARAHNDKGVLRTMIVTTAIPLDTIQAERAKLKERDDETK